jgi:hypothetical protein
VNKKATIILAALFLTFGASRALAQGRTPPTQEELKASRDSKFQAAWYTSNDWTADYDAARKRAKEQKKLIFAYFLPSYFN